MAASNIIHKKIVCPKCGEPTEADLHTSVNVTNHRDLRAKVMNESLFRWSCKNCGYSARLTYPVLYNDMKNRFMVYLIPRIEHFQLADKQLEDEFNTLKHIDKRIVPDFNTFKEKIFIFESGLDDMAVELTKLAISKIVAKKHNVEEIPTVGEMFDPSVHEAVSSVQMEGKQSGEIVQEFRKGYKIGSKVLRHSMVVVNQ